MPPVTPSPHRFLPGRRRQHSPAQGPRPPRETRPQQFRSLSQRDATPQRQAPFPPNDKISEQFAKAPRFSIGGPAQGTTRVHSPPKPSLAQALRRSIRPTENVEDTQVADHDDEEMLDVPHEDVWPTTELLDSAQKEDPQAWTHELPYSPKRRKLDNFECRRDESPARPVFKHPTTPASHYALAAHNFVRAGSVASSVASNDTVVGRRPAFLRSSVAPTSPFEPLPEAFSPHRRGEKFVSGGMAASLQQWVIETGQAAAQSRRGQGYLDGEDYVFRLEVESCTGTGPVLVRNKRCDGEEVRVMLIINTKWSAVDVRPGRIVGIRAPTWEIELSGEMWHVGVDWKVVSQA